MNNRFTNEKLLATMYNLCTTDVLRHRLRDMRRNNVDSDCPNLKLCIKELDRRNQLKLEELSPEFLQRRMDRDRKKRSVRTLATEAGVSPGTIYKFIQGRHSMSVSSFRKVLTVLKKT